MELAHPRRIRNQTDPPALRSGVIFSAAVMMGYHVASRAARDTLFLTNLVIQWLPLMGVAAASLSIVGALYAGARMATTGPRPLVPTAFVISAALTLIEWWLVVRWPAAGAVALFVHIALFGPVLVSGFWSILNDSLDARTTRDAIGRISALATIGGLAGLVLAERITAWFGLPATMPALAAANLWCAWSTARLPGSPPRQVSEVPQRASPAIPGSWRVLSGVPHLRNLALIVLGASVSAALLEYLFRVHAKEQSRQSLDLMRVFLGFNGIVTLGTFAMQISFTRLVKSREWLLRTIGPLPAAVLFGGVTAAFVPAPWYIAAVRGSEAILHGSLFRGGFELLYAGLPKAQKNLVRTLIDVVCDRAGDIVGGAIILFVLYYLPVASTTSLLLLSSAVAGATLLVVMRLPRGYISSLEEALRELGPREAGQLARLSSLQFSMGASGISGPEIDPVKPPAGKPVVTHGGPEADPHSPDPRPAPLRQARPDSDIERFVDALRALRSGNAERARAAILNQSQLDEGLVSQVIRLLGTEGVGSQAVGALIPVAERHVGQLLDALLDPDGDLAVRSSIPPILSTCLSPRAVEGLSHGLMDHQFEVRASCALALARMQERGSAPCLDRELVFAAVLWEARFGRQIWEPSGPRRPPGPLDEFLHDRAERSLDHVFTVLSLALPRAPLMIALHGLKGSDPSLRGTALEYLDGVLPQTVREALRAVLEAAPHRIDPRR